MCLYKFLKVCLSIHVFIYLVLKFYLYHSWITFTWHHLQSYCLKSYFHLDHIFLFCLELVSLKPKSSFFKVFCFLLSLIFINLLFKSIGPCLLKLSQIVCFYITWYTSLSLAAYSITITKGFLFFLCLFIIFFLSSCLCYRLFSINVCMVTIFKRYVKLLRLKKKVTWL